MRSGAGGAGPSASGRVGRAAAYALGDRYDELESLLRGRDIVHAAELHTWFSAQAARLRARLGFRLALTVWETIPFLEAYRWPRERAYRRRVLEAADLLLPATERARRTLLLEGVDPARCRSPIPGSTPTALAPAPDPRPRRRPISFSRRAAWCGRRDIRT